MYLVPRTPSVSVNDDSVNGNHADIHITSRGSDFYWAWTAIFTLAFLGVVAWTQTLTVGRRLFHNTTTIIMLVTAITYFSMASNLGWAGIDVEWHRSRSQVSGATRQIFWVRYIGWFITFPLILSNMYFSSGLSWQALSSAIIYVWVFVIGRLLGALVSSTYKWGYFVFSLLTYFYIVYELLFFVRTNATSLGEDIRRAFFLPAVLQASIWLLYPIAWGCSEGGNLIAPDSEAVFYGVLDFFALLVIPIFTLFSLRSIDPVRFNAAGTPATAHTEKHTNGTSATHATNGTENTTTAPV